MLFLPQNLPDGLRLKTAKASDFVEVKIYYYCSLIFIETVEEQATDEEASRICLSDKISLELAKLAVKLEAIFRNARDIEFAIRDVSNIL